MEQNSGVGLNPEIKLYTTSRGSDMTRQKIRRTHGETRALAAQLFTDGKICFTPSRKIHCVASVVMSAWPPWCHDGEGIYRDILTWDHNALSYRNGRLIILPTPSHFSHIYQNNVRFLDLMFEDTKYHGYTHLSVKTKFEPRVNKVCSHYIIKEYGECFTFYWL